MIIYAMRWHRLVWTAAVVAVMAVIGLGIDVAVEGMSAAAELAGIIVAFCELSLLLLAIIAFIRDRRHPGGQPEPNGQAAATNKSGKLSAAKYQVDVRDSTGIIIGERNEQKINIRRSANDS